MTHASKSPLPTGEQRNSDEMLLSKVKKFTEDMRRVMKQEERAIQMNSNRTDAIDSGDQCHRKIKNPNKRHATVFDAT